MVNDVGDLLEGRELSFNPGGVAPTSRAMQLLALNPSYEAGKKKKEKQIAFSLFENVGCSEGGG